MERHPLEPFISKNTKLIIMGSFPPKAEKWAMDFYYPNFQNDMWRIFGLVFFEDKDYFLDDTKKKFDKYKIQDFLNAKGIGVCDTVKYAVRLKDNASDKYLEAAEALDLGEVLRACPLCTALISAGGKSAELTSEYFAIEKESKIGEIKEFQFEGRTVNFCRVPSSSRAYPMALSKKAEIYKTVLDRLLPSI